MTCYIFHLLRLIFDNPFCLFRHLKNKLRSLSGLLSTLEYLLGKDLRPSLGLCCPPTQVSRSFSPITASTLPTRLATRSENISRVFCVVSLMRSYVIAL